MTRPDISVIILTYNQQHTVAQAIESVLAQNTPDYCVEIVIGDDGSTDATRDICSGYAARYPERIRLMPEAPNKGVVRNYFDTLEACRGRYIADCAGDDYWIDAHRLQRQASYLDSHPEVVMVHGAWREVNSRGDTLAHVEPYGMNGKMQIMDGRELMEPLLAHRRPLTLHLSTAVYRAATAADAIAANRKIVINQDFECEDLSLTAALLSRGKVAYMPQEVLAYRVGEPTVSNPRSIARALGFYSATVSCTAELATHYGISSKSLDRYFRSRFIFLSKLSRHLHTPGSIQVVEETVKATGRPMPLLARILLICARIRG